MSERHICSFCGFAYDEGYGAPDDGIAAGTAWTDVPYDWVCPDCGNGKESFQLQDW